MKLLQVNVIAFIILTTVACKQDRYERIFDITNFSPIPPRFSNQREILYSQINPDSSYDYWEVNEAGRLTTYKGDSSKYASLAKKYHCGREGFFVECMPMVCYSYIVAFKNGKPKLICTEKDLATFIGRIDNLEEAILIAKVNNYWYDEENKKGGAYIERKDDYLLYLLDWSSNPVTYKSVRAILNKSGRLEIIDKKVYFENKGLYISH